MVHLAGNQHIPSQGNFEDDSPFPKVEYVSSLDGRFSFFWGVVFILLVGGWVSLVWKMFRIFHPEICAAFCGSEELSVAIGFLRAPNL